MDTKSKWLETELWLQVAAVVANVITAVVGVLPVSWSPILLALQAALYTWYRQQTKNRANATTFSATLEAIEPREAVVAPTLKSTSAGNNGQATADS